MATIYGSSSGGKKYTIGSQKGQDFVNNAKAGSTLTGADGSTWTKNRDGSTTIVQNGVSYTVGGASSGSASSKGSSGGASSGGSYSGSSSGGASSRGSYSGSSSGGASGSASGYTGSFRDYSSTPTGTWNPNAPKYTGGNAELDAYLALKSQEYFAAKANNDARGMADANNAANQARNYFGYAAENATADINNTIRNGSPTGTMSGSSGGGSTGGSSNSWTSGGGSWGSGIGGWGSNVGTGGSGGQVNDLSDYLEEMYAAQRKAALASIESAYQQNLNAISRAGQGLDSRYQAARNQAAGASALAGRNFAEYAAAYGLGSGAAGQAELARNVALQNDLNSLNTEEANVYADLELQKANAETNYNAAIAEAEASNNSQLAAALYQEKVRVQNELIAQQQQLFENSLAERQFQYQQQQAQIANDQWQQAFDYQKEQDAAAQAEANRSYLAGWGETLLQNGFLPTEEMLAAMGMTEAQANAVLNAIRMQSAASAPTYSYKSGNDNILKEPIIDDTPKPPEIKDETEGSGINPAYFNAAMRTLSTQLESGKENLALSGIESIWKNLDNAQKTQTNTLLSKYGQYYEE